MLSRRGNSQKGFTLIELLIVVAIIGILAAIAIPNLLTAMQRSKQKRTMADIRSIATAWEAYAVDENAYTAAGIPEEPTQDQTTEGTDWSEMSYSSVAGRLSPDYIKNLPANDGWGNAYEYFTAENGQRYSIDSMGKDGVRDEGSAADGPTTDFNCDIVYENGSFVQYPEGKQQ